MYHFFGTSELDLIDGIILSGEYPILFEVTKESTNVSC